jgi:hypothetical protein
VISALGIDHGRVLRIRKLTRALNTSAFPGTNRQKSG